MLLTLILLVMFKILVNFELTSILKIKSCCHVNYDKRTNIFWESDIS